MNDKKLDITLQDPQLPSRFDQCRRNHGGMTVPEGFFESFEAKMNAAIDADVASHQPSLKPQTETRKETPGQRRWLAIAATVVVIFVLGIVAKVIYFGEQLPTDDPTINGIAQIEQNQDQQQQQEEPEIALPEPVAEAELAAANDFDVYETCFDL